MQPEEEHRHFIRHQAGVPIRVRDSSGAVPHTEPGLNVSHGGLAFLAEDALEPGLTVEVRIDEVVPPFEANARVAWCQARDDRFVVGVEFLDSRDAFRSRMVQQVCAIGLLQREMSLVERREVSRQEAASAWIRRNAASFPRT